MEQRTRKAGNKNGGQSVPPVTSTTMLREIGGDINHVRWQEFVDTYWPMMEANLESHDFPEDEREDIIQATLAAVAKVLPNYRYCPGEKGAFHNYLTGILLNKVADARRRKAHWERRVQAFGEQEAVSGRMRLALDYDTGDGENERRPERVWATESEVPGVSREEWGRSICQIAVQQLLANETMSPQSREIFRRVWVEGESEGAVAESLMVDRNVVYQTKHRMLKRVEETVKKLMEVEINPERDT